MSINSVRISKTLHSYYLKILVSITNFLPSPYFHYTNVHFIPTLINTPSLHIVYDIRRKTLTFIIYIRGPYWYKNSNQTRDATHSPTPYEAKIIPKISRGYTYCALSAIFFVAV